jgi:hypothetical protein
MSIKHFTGNEYLRKDDGTLIIGMMLRSSIRQGTVTIATSATKIPTSPLSERLSIVIVNISNNIVYLGNSSVTTANGYPIYPRQSISFYIEDNIDIYGIAESSSECRILEGG